MFIVPNVSGAGLFTIEIYEYGREVIFSENQTTQTIYMDGTINYTGSSVTGDTIELSTNFDLGESSITPENVVFHISGSEEFIVELIIPNIYENGTNGTLQVRGDSLQGTSSITSDDYAGIIIINHSDIDNGDNNLNNLKNHKKDDSTIEITDIFMISTIIIIIAIIIIVIYKKKGK
jgi:subtilase family serine protease